MTVPKVSKGLLNPGAEGVGRAVKGQTDGAGGREKIKMQRISAPALLQQLDVGCVKELET